MQRALLRDLGGKDGPRPTVGARVSRQPYGPYGRRRTPSRVSQALRACRRRSSMCLKPYARVANVGPRVSCLTRMAQAFVQVSQALRVCRKRSSTCLKPYAFVSSVHPHGSCLDPISQAFVLVGKASALSVRLGRLLQLPGTKRPPGRSDLRGSGAAASSWIGNLRASRPRGMPLPALPVVFHAPRSAVPASRPTV
jgi:hypothetical protein